MTSVIPYEPQYQEAVKRLCLEALGCLSAGEETQRFTSLMKCDYYLEFEPQHCLLSVDDEKHVVGCILCAVDYDAYERDFSARFLPAAAAMSVKRYVDAKLGLIPYAMFRGLYKAHFSLYVQSAWSGLGIGSDLTDAVLALLKREGVDGAVTLCEAENEDAVAFFKQKGFHSVLTTKFGHAMSYQFPEEGN